SDHCLLHRLCDLVDGDCLARLIVQTHLGDFCTVSVEDLDRPGVLADVNERGKCQLGVRKQTTKDADHNGNADRCKAQDLAPAGAKESTVGLEVGSSPVGGSNRV